MRVKNQMLFHAFVADACRSYLRSLSSDARLRGYVVWVPKVGATENDVADASRLARDTRSRHYWDEGGRLMATYTGVLALPEDAWDIYMVYGPAARWEGNEPPRPHYWMHQLGSRDHPRVGGPFLDGKTFADRVSSLLAAASAPPTTAGTGGEEATSEAH